MRRDAQRCAAKLLGLFVCCVAGLPSRAQSPNLAWNVKVLRMEGAAVSMREAAESLQRISLDVSASGRAQQAAMVHSAAKTLRRKVASASLAAEVLHEGISTPIAP
jgi:hypothetical protein